MALTNDQLKRLWLTEQTSSNPRYSFMSAADKAAFDAQLSNYYDTNQQTFIDKYSSDPIDTPVSTNVVDDSGRVPFGTQEAHLIYDTTKTIIEPKNSVPLIDNINNRILWMDQYLQNLLEVWIYDGPPVSSNLLDRLYLSNNAQIFKVLALNPIPNIDSLNELLLYNAFIVDNNVWISVDNPLDNYLFWDKNPKGFSLRADKAVLSGGFTKQQIVNGLDNGLYDPIHPEEINSTWLFESKTDTFIYPFSFIFNGGSIISDVKLNILFIGDIPNKQDLIRFHTDLFNYVNLFNLIKQYGINSGVVSANQSIGLDGAKDIDDYNIQQHIQGAIDLLEPDSSTFYIVYIASNIDINNYKKDKDGIVSYHKFFQAKNGYNCRYGVVKIHDDIKYTTIPGSRMLINGITNPEGNGWLSNDSSKKELCDFDSAGTIVTPGDQWYISTIFNSATRGVGTGSQEPILFPIYQPGIINFGGPIVANSQVVLVFIGDIWLTKDLETVTGEPYYPIIEYIDFLCTQNEAFLNILRQYGILTAIRNSIKYIPGVALTQTKASIQTLLQDNITSGNLPEPNDQLIYLCFLDGNIDMSGDPELGHTWNPYDPFYFDVAVHYTDHFITVGGHSFRFGVEKMMEIPPKGSSSILQNPDRFFTVNITRMFANIITDPDGNAWHPIDDINIYGDKIGVGNYGSTTANENFTPRPGDEPILASIWDQHSRSNKFLQTVPIFNNDPLIKYHGGAIVKQPKIYVIFIGDGSQAYAADVIYYFQVLVSTVALSSIELNQTTIFGSWPYYVDLYMNVLRQYGIVSGSVNSTPIYFSGVSGLLNEAYIQGLLQSAINGNVIPEPDNHNIYLCYVDHNIQMLFGSIWAPNVPLSAEIIGHFNTTAGHSCRYAIIKTPDPAGVPDDISLQKEIYVIGEATVNATKAFANLITNPDGDAWFSDAGKMVSDYFDGVAERDGWPLWQIYDDYDQINVFGSLIPITKVMRLDNSMPTVITNYYWRLTELEPFDPTFRLKITKDYDTQRNEISWDLHGQITGITYDQWYTKYIEPLAKKELTFTNKVTLDEIIKTFDVKESFVEVEVIGNNGRTAILKVNYRSENVETLYLYYNDPNEGWININILPYLPNDATIEEMIRLRPGLYKATNGKKIIWNGVSIQSIQTEDNILYDNNNLKLDEPNMFFPNQYLLLKRNGMEPIWANKIKPWEVIFYDLNTGPLFFTLSSLYFKNFSVDTQLRNPFSWEIQDPTKINSQWSIESTDLNGVITWQFGGFSGDPNYKLMIKPQDWTDSNGNKGLNCIVVGYQHTDLNGIIKQVKVDWWTTNIDIKNGGSIINTGGLPTLDIDAQNTYFNTYTTGGNIISNSGDWDNGAFLVFGKGAGIGFDEAYTNVDNVVIAFNTFTEISRHVAIGPDDPRIGDYILMEGKELVSFRTIRIYHEYVPWRMWFSIADQENKIGGFFITKVYLP